MKKLLLFFTLCLLLQGVNAQYKMVQIPMNRMSNNGVQTKDSKIPDVTYPAGYCDGTPNLVGGVGMNQSATMGVAVQLPKAMLKGTQIYAIRTAITSLGTDCSIFISKDLSKDPVYTQNVTIQDIENWSYIILDTPYSVTDGDTYIGYSITSDEYPLGMEMGKTANKKADWISTNGGKWENLSTSSQGQLLGSWALQAILIGGDYSSENQYDMASQRMTYKPYVKTNQLFDFGVSVCNYGVQTIKNFDVTYKVGDKTETKSVSGVALPYGMSYYVELPQQKITEEGTYEIAVNAANLNGNPDEVSGNDVLKNTVKCYVDWLDRQILIEQFTGQGCGNCPAGEEKLRKSLEELEGRYAWVAHHTYYTDDFTIDESLKYAKFFGTNGAAPYCTIDRTEGSVAQSGIVFHPGYSTPEMMEEYLEVPSFASVKLDGSSFDNDTKTLTVKVSGEVIRELPNAKLNVFLTEDGIIARQSGASNDYTHDHAIRAVLTELYGDEITLENGKYTKTYTYTIPASIKKFKCNPYNMKVVAFVADYTSTSNKKCNVHNSNYLALKDLGAVSGINNAQMNEVSIYAEDGMVYVEGEYNEISVYTTSGSLVKKMTKEDSFSLENGLYIIKVINGENSLVRKVTVNK